jgi:hypothetical protein
MEFLMTYGWAILVVLIAIGALAYFGVLNPSRFLPESCTIGPGVGCDDYKVTFASSDASTIQLLLRNGIGESLTAVGVAITGCTVDADASGDDAWTDGDILGGATGITLTACPAAAVPSSGGRVKVDITITYTGSSGLVHTKTGTLTARAE